MKRREGQALVIAALSVLILSIAVLSTVNLGHHIGERIRLQNTSDAAAYSMAAMEARAFNFYAFANRTQVSHYVTAMLWQSLLSFTYWAEAFLVDIYGVMKTLNPCANPSGPVWTVICKGVIPLIPVIGPIINALSSIMGLYRTFLASMVLPLIRALNPDAFVGRLIIPAYRIMNEVLAAASQATLVATMTHITNTSQDVIVANDQNISSLASRAVSGVLSACILDRAHYQEANGRVSAPRSPFTPLNPTAIKDNDRTSRAKRMMGAVANATRFACDNPGSNCGPGWVTSRKPADLIKIPGIGIFQQLLDALGIFHKVGQTKLLSYTYSRYTRATGPNGPGGNFIRDWKEPVNVPVGGMAQGDAMGSDDLYHIKIGPPTLLGLKNPLSCKDSDSNDHCWGDPSLGRWDNGGRDLPYRPMHETSIWALSKSEVKGGVHWRLVYPTGGGGFYPSQATYNDRPLRYPKNFVEARIGLSEYKKSILPFGLPPKVSVWVANTRLVRDGNHDWGGITPFSHFEPGQYANACPGGSGPSLTNGAQRRDAPNQLQSEFNQPSSFVILNKKAAEMENSGDTTGAGNVKPAMLNLQKSMTFQLKAPTTLTFDDTKMTFMGAKGLNVVTRAQTYYHRPGNWHEHPNFFNPYWRPRLASVWQGNSQVPFVSQVLQALPGPVGGTPVKFLTH